MVKKVDAELLEDIRRLNVVLYEDDKTITAVSPCPTATHRPEKVAPSYVVRFACPHGKSVHVFCAPCTVDRRVGTFACLGEHLVDEDCPGSVVVEAQTLVPITLEKA